MYTTKVPIASTALSLWALSAGAVTVSPENAMGEIGRNARVCGVVASAVYQANSPADPTFVTLVNADQPNVNRALTAVIYRSDRAKFGSAPETSLEGKRMCVIGFVRLLPAKAEMILSTSKQVFYLTPPSVAELK